MVKSSKSMLLALAMLAASAAHADERGSFQITPFAGYSHLRVDGNHLREGVTDRMDQLMVGVSGAYRAPFGLVVELSNLSAVHDNWLDSGDGFGLRQQTLALGYELSFGDGWRLTPKAGRMKWKLERTGRDLLDNAGVRRTEWRGYENYYEIALAREISSWFSLGIHFRDVAPDYGHSRSGAITATFEF